MLHSVKHLPDIVTCSRSINEQARYNPLMAYRALSLTLEKPEYVATYTNKLNVIFVFIRC